MERSAFADYHFGPFASPLWWKLPWASGAQTQPFQFQHHSACASDQRTCESNSKDTFKRSLYVHLSQTPEFFNRCSPRTPFTVDRNV